MNFVRRSTRRESSNIPGPEEIAHKVGTQDVAQEGMRKSPIESKMDVIIRQLGLNLVAGNRLETAGLRLY